MAVLSSAGRLIETGTPVWTVPGGDLSWGSVESYDAQRNSITFGEMYRAQPAIRTVVDFLARNIAQLGIKPYRRLSDTDRETLDGSHPFARTLSRPDPDRSGYVWKRALVSDLAIYDVAYHAKFKGRDGRIGLLRLPPERTRPVGGNFFTPEGYELTGSKGAVTLRADQVVAMWGYNPLDPRTGTSGIHSLRLILAEDEAASTFMAQHWRRGGRMSGWIERPMDAPAWSDTARSRFSSSWRAAYAGPRGTDAAGTPLLEEGMKFHEASYSPRDAQMVEGRRLTLEQVAIAYHIAPTMLGLLEHATFSNIEHQHRHLYQDTLGPWLEWISEEVDAQILPEFSDLTDVYTEFNLAAKLNGSFAEQSAAYQASVGAPWMTRNEARARMNLPAVPDGDELVTPLNVLVGGQASPLDSAPEPSERDDDGLASIDPDEDAAERVVRLVQ